MPVPALRRRLALCLAFFITQLAWIQLWPHTGFSDSPLHFLNIQATAGDPARALSPWARPLFVALMFLPVQLGYFAARAFAALLAAVLLWHTMRLADHLRLPRATIAGALLALQPVFFAVASDTLTELPMALALVLVLRLWWSRRHAAACLLAGFLPLLRPEGFAITPLCAALVLATPAIGSLLTYRLPSALLLAAGPLAWALASWILIDDPLWTLHAWSWPLQSYATYGHGTLHDMPIRWIYYCGPVLLVLFLAGIRPALRRPMLLPWALWALVFFGHGILWWQGWLASLGLPRIQATAAPFTALICLHGWNALAGRLAPHRRRFAALAALGIATSTVFLWYQFNGYRHRGFGIRATARTIQKSELLRDTPALLAGDPTLLIDLGIPLGSPLHTPIPWDRAERYALLDALPAGSLVAWDDQRARQWYGLTFDDLEAHGFEPLGEIEHRVRLPLGLACFPPGTATQRFALFRKR